MMTIEISFNYKYREYFIINIGNTWDSDTNKKKSHYLHFTAPVKYSKYWLVYSSVLKHLPCLCHILDLIPGITKFKNFLKSKIVLCGATCLQSQCSRRLRQKNQKFKPNLSNSTIPCLKI